MKRALLASLIGLAACAGAAPPPPAAPVPPVAAPPLDRAAAERDVRRELDDLHDAAARGDEARYVDHYTKDAVFLGTDASERWDLATLRAYFAAHHGWVYHVARDAEGRERRGVGLSADGGVAWFDEALDGKKAGPTRGSGVLVHAEGRWRVAQYNLTFTVPNDRFPAVRLAIDGLRARHDAAYRDAVAAAAAGEPAKADAILSALVPEAKTLPAEDVEFWLHNELTWLRWAAGDLAGARAEVERARTALDHGTLPEVAVSRLRLHELWDRAYLALEDALAAPPRARAARIAEADAARAAYEARAKPANDRDGMAVLAAFFATRKGQKRVAAEEARKVDPRDTDLQDLYVVVLALEAAGDRGGAAAALARICAGGSGLMAPLVRRALQASGHACPR